jgi:predicted metal-dependent phosphoesterase TrpH
MGLCLGTAMRRTEALQSLTTSFAPGRWRVELHSHTHWSKDCIVKPETILRLCQLRGIDRVAITDHNTADGALEMHAFAPDKVIVGEEIMTTQGELLGYFMTETVPPGLTPEETIRRLRRQGAVISVSHPFDRLRKGAWEEQDLMRIVHEVDAIEVFNARCMFGEDNVKAVQFARKHGVCGTFGSDAHSSVEYGRAVALMNPFNNAAEFLAALETSKADCRYSSWFVHVSSKTAKWSKKLGLKPRLWSGG